MEMKRCERGHYYDATIHNECPYCNKEQNVGATVAAGMTEAAGQTSRTTSFFETVKNGNGAEGRTVAMIQKDMGIDPVVGWLVCTDGSEKGRDYRIHSDNNYIGRSERMDICIRGDETISRENQAVITFDSLDKAYYFSPGDGRSIVRVNGRAIFQTTTLEAYDKVMVGKTELLFVPLCGERFEWERKEQET